MKRIFLVGAIAISAMALATASNGTGNSNSNPSLVTSCYNQDTIPKKDTTKIPKRDSLVVTQTFN